MQHWILKWCRCFFQAIDGRSREKPWTKDEFLTAAVVVAGTGLPTSATCHTSTPTIAAALAKKVPLFHQFLNFGGAHEQRHAYLYWRKCLLVMNAQWKREKKPHLGGAGRTWEHLLIQARNSHHHHKTREHASKQCNHIQRRFFRSSIFAWWIESLAQSLKRNELHMELVWRWNERSNHYHTNGAYLHSFVSDLKAELGGKDRRRRKGSEELLVHDFWIVSWIWQEKERWYAAARSSIDNLTFPTMSSGRAEEEKEALHRLGRWHVWNRITFGQPPKFCF